MKYIKQVFIVIVFWYIVSFFVGFDVAGNKLVPPPHIVLVQYIKSFNEINVDTLATLLRLMVSLIIALIIGGVIGIHLGLKKKFSPQIYPIVNAFYPLPKATLTPILISLTGLNDLSKIILVVSILIFPIIITIRDAILNIDIEYFEAVEIMNLKGYRYYKEFLIPAIAPRILTAVKISIGGAIAVLYLAESMVQSVGLGYYITNNSIDRVDMFVGITMLSIIGFVMFSIIDYFEERELKKYK